MKINDLEPLLLVQTPNHELLKVSNVYDTTVTAQVLLPVQSRTTVRTYGVDQIKKWKQPTEHLLNRYEVKTGQRAERK